MPKTITPETRERMREARLRYLARRTPEEVRRITWKRQNTLRKKNNKTLPGRFTASQTYYGDEE